MDAAYEEVPLWDLTAEIENHAVDGSVRVEPGLPRDVVLAAVEDALCSGDITLYDRADANKRDLSLSQALAVARDAEYWSHERAPRAICLFLTDAGMARMGWKAFCDE